jgi:RNA polymerase sigma factor (sigma-70 family)
MDEIAALRQNARAWDGVWEPLWATAKSAATHVLGGFLADDIEDVAIKSLTKIVRRLEFYPDIKTLKQLRDFTASVAYDEAKSHLRENQAKKRGGGLADKIDADSKEAQNRPDSHQPRPDELAEAHERAKFVSDLLDPLQPRDKNILVDFYLRGYRHRELAEIYGLALGSIGTSIKRALDKLRYRLANDSRLQSHAHELVRLSAILFILLIA